MKLNCELCGGVLQFHKGCGDMAICGNCGLGYSTDRLRERMEAVATVEELISSFTSLPLNLSDEDLEEDDVYAEEPELEPPDPFPEVAFRKLLEPTPTHPRDIHLLPRDRYKGELAAKAAEEDSFLMVVDDVYSVGTIGADVIGTVSCGTIKPGEHVMINGKQVCEVAAIEHHGLIQEFAWKGMDASILLKELKKDEVSRGDVLTLADTADGAAATEVIPTHRNPLIAGRVLTEADFVAGETQQFSMRVNKAARRRGFRTWYITLDGYIEQGCVANLDSVFLNGSSANTWTVLSVDSKDLSAPLAYNRASAGMNVSILICGEHKAAPASIQSLVGVAAPEESLDHFPGTPQQYFSSILVKHFYPRHKILADADYDGVDLPITYLFCRDEAPKLAVFLLDSFDGPRRYKVEKAMNVCRAKGIPAMQFFMDYRNSEHFISMRIRQALS